MFDYLVTAIHIMLFSGIILLCLVLRSKQSESAKMNKESDSSNSFMDKNPMFIITFLVLAWSFPQVSSGNFLPAEPELSKPTWSKETEHGTIHMYLSPEKPRALQEFRIYIQLDSEEFSQTSLLDLLQTTKIVVQPAPQSDASLVVSPYQLDGFLFDSKTLVWKTNISMPGPFNLKVVSGEDGLLSEMPIAQVEIEEYSYLEFKYEFTIFVVGCIAVAFLYFLILRSLHCNAPVTDLPYSQTS